MLDCLPNGLAERPKAIQVVIGGGVIDLDFDDSLSAIWAWGIRQTGRGAVRNGFGSYAKGDGPLEAHRFPPITV
jgi:hypothetical protein